MSVTLESGAGWTMYHGDCLEILPALEPVDHVITDPPYEAEAHTKQRRSLGRRVGPKRVVNAVPIDFDPIDDDIRRRVASEISRLARRWSIVFCQVEAAMKWRDALASGGALYRRTCVWIKPDGQPQLSGDRPGMGYESIVCCHASRKSRWNGGGRLGVFVFSKSSGTGAAHEHPTMKPVPLMAELVRLFSDAGESLLDPFAGSGTTGVAALRLGRRFVGIERDERYFRLAVERLRAEETGSTLDARRAGQAALFGGST